MEQSSNGKFEDTQHVEAEQVLADVEESVKEVTVDENSESAKNPEEEEVDTSIVPLPPQEEESLTIDEPKEAEEKSVPVSDGPKEAAEKSVSSVSDEPNEAEEKSVLSVSNEPKEAEVSSSLTDDVVSKGIEEAKDSSSETNNNRIVDVANDGNPESKGNDLQNSWKNCCGLFELLRDSNR